MSELAAGRILSGHRIDGVIGRGGMGVVYRAQHLALGRTVALKVIAPELVDDAGARERFLREARSAASIDHPHVIPVLHAGEEDGVTFLVMRYVAGDDVRTLVRRTGALAAARAATIAAQAAGALDAIHAAGLVHRDVKPGNVLLDAGDHVYVTDFGLAKEVVSHGGATRSGHWVGTLGFVAPEQIRGERVDARTDVYALGGLLFYMLTGGAPYSAHAGEEAKLWAHLTEPPPRPSAVRPGLPAAFDAVVARAMAKDPGDRHPSAGDVGRAALAAVHDENPTHEDRTVAVGAAAPAEAELASPRRRRFGRTATAIAAVAALVAGAAAVGLLGRSGGGDREPRAGPAAPAPSAETPPAPRVVRVGATIEDVGRRPNAIAVAGGTVWVGSAALDRLTRLDAETGRRLPGEQVVGRTVVAMTDTGPDAWVALARPGRLVRLEGGARRAADTLPLPGDPTALDASPDAVWVAVRAGAADLLLRYDPWTRRRVGRVQLRARVRALAAGPDGVWLAHRGEPIVEHLDRRTGRRTVRARLRRPAYDLAYGAGYAWASMPAGDAVARISPRTGAAASIAAPRRPMQLVVSAGRVFVAGFSDHTVGVIDARRGRPEGRPLRAGLNPFAVAGGRERVWVTAIGSSSVTRLDLP